MTDRGVPTSSGSPSTSEPSTATSRGRLSGIWEQISRNPTLGLLALLMVMWALAALFVPNFGTPENIRNVLRQASDLSVAAIGILFVLLIGGIDLSVGALYGLVSVVLVTVMIETGSFPLSLKLAAISTNILMRSCGNTTAYALPSTSTIMLTLPISIGGSFAEFRITI